MHGKTLNPKEMAAVFTREKLDELFPADRTNAFFDALFGDAEEGAYDISLRFDPTAQSAGRLLFELHLTQRPGRCLACNLTHGLPEVFSRHPLINIAGLVREIGSLLAGKATIAGWKLATTRQISKALHIVPLEIQLA